LQRAGEDEAVGGERIDDAHLVGRPELVEQPAGVVAAPVGDQRVEQFLVVAVFGVMPGEPAESLATGAFCLDQALGELHGVSTMTLSRRASRRGGGMAVMAADAGGREGALRGQDCTMNGAPERAPGKVPCGALGLVPGPRPHGRGKHGGRPRDLEGELQRRTPGGRAAACRDRQVGRAVVAGVGHRRWSGKMRAPGL